MFSFFLGGGGVYRDFYDDFRVFYFGHELRSTAGGMGGPFFYCLEMKSDLLLFRFFICSFFVVVVVLLGVSRQDENEPFLIIIFNQ